MFPVSVKGVAVQDGKVLLLRNERDEWELPGGKLEVGEDPADCVVREISEESGWPVTAGAVARLAVRGGCGRLRRDRPVGLPRAEHRTAGRQPRAHAGWPVRSGRGHGAGDTRWLQAFDRGMVRPAGLLGWARRKPCRFNVVDPGYAVDWGYSGPPNQP
jgi:8-oxo-dGTP pyrophosphatase MutT (NUDIX family)